MLSQFAVTIVIEWIVKEEVPHILARFNGFTLCVLKTSETSNEVLIIYQILRRNCGLAVVGLVSGCNDFAYQWPCARNVHVILWSDCLDVHSQEVAMPGEVSVPAPMRLNVFVTHLGAFGVDG